MNILRRGAGLLAVALLCVAAPRATPAAPASAGAAANPAARTASRWAAAWSAKRLDAVVGLYATDAVFLPSNGDPASGTEAIRELMQKGLAAATPSIRVRSTHAGRSGALAYDTGEYEETVLSAAGSESVRGSYVLVCRRERGGQWRIVLHAWTETARKPS
jgi:uncharacterized protein (TIGR02246 family)